MATFGVSKELPVRFIQCFADSSQFNLSNLTNLFIEIKKQIDPLGTVHKRIYIDIISSLHMLHAPKSVYVFISGLLQYLKDHGAVVVASLDEGVVALEAQRSMEMVFDGAIEIRLCEEKFNIVPLMRVKKMMSQFPNYNYHRIAISKGEVHFTDFVT